MSANYTHKFRLHGALIQHNEPNTAAAVTFDDGATREFASAAATAKKPAEEPTATMQAIHAAKAAMLARDEAEQAERLAKRDAAIAKAKDRSEAATNPTKPETKGKA